ncbi:MAG: tetratricopeptide repeat protein [Herpetosiphon sp.]
MTKLDEQMRLRKRLVERAVEMAGANRWEEALVVNRQLLQMGPDVETHNRIGKALMELGRVEEAIGSYNETLQINPSNQVARKNVARLGHVVELGDSPTGPIERKTVDSLLFIIEPGKTALTTLTNVTSRTQALRLVPGEVVGLEPEGKEVRVIDDNHHVIGQLEPQLAQRLIDLLQQGNKYQAVIANLDDTQIKVLIREVFQTPAQRSIVSFPGKLAGDVNVFRTYHRELPQYELDDADLLEDEELLPDDLAEPEDEDFFRGSTTGEEEEVGLEELEADIKDDDDEN